MHAFDPASTGVAKVIIHWVETTCRLDSTPFEYPSPANAIRDGIKEELVVLFTGGAICTEEIVKEAYKYSKYRRHAEDRVRYYPEAYWVTVDGITVDQHRYEFD